MKQIDEYLNNLYKGLVNSEVSESKEEMKIHILEVVNELKQEGKGEQQAIEIALERFGDENFLNGGLLSLFNKQKKFSSSLLKIGIWFLVIAIIAALILIALDTNFFVHFEENLPFTLLFMITNAFFAFAGVLLVISLLIAFIHKKKIRLYQMKS